MTDKCLHCGANMTRYWHRLSRGIVNALVKFKKAVVYYDRNSIHLLKDLQGSPFELTRHEWNNFTKLRFHGLAVKTTVPGYWLLTQRGNQFLLGDLRVPKSVQTYRNRVVDHSHELVGVADVLNEIPVFDDKKEIINQSTLL